LSYPKICLKYRTVLNSKDTVVFRDRMFSEVLGVLEIPPTLQITAMDSFRNDSNVGPEFFNTAETHLVGDDSDHPHRPYSSALSHVL